MKERVILSRGGGGKKWTNYRTISLTTLTSRIWLDPIGTKGRLFWIIQIKIHVIQIQNRSDTPTTTKKMLERIKSRQVSTLRAIYQLFFSWWQLTWFTKLPNFLRLPTALSNEVYKLSQIANCLSFLELVSILACILCDRVNIRTISYYTTCWTLTQEVCTSNILQIAIYIRLELTSG